MKLFIGRNRMNNRQDRLKRALTTLVALTFILVVPNSSLAELVMGPNGNMYEVVIDPGIFVGDAGTAASGSELCGTPGHLATITSEEEDLFLESIRAAAAAAVWDQTNDGAKQEFWVGGYQDDNSGDVDTDWHWVNDDGDIIIGATYTNWIDWPEGVDEPSDGWDGDPGQTAGTEDNTENHLAIGIGGNFGWNDESDGGADYNILGYIVEYDRSTSASTIPVSGEACVHFAGQSGPVPDFGWNETDASIPPFIEVCGGGTLSISAAGTWGHPPLSGPNGYGVSELTLEQYDDLGISLLTADLNMLVGVFLTDDPPDPGATPPSLTFGDDMTSPELQQAFVIGSSLSDIQVPSGATRLFFGLHDGYEWSNNTGEVEVEVMFTSAVLADIDIKPTSCPNPLNLKSKGVLPVAIVGSESFDVFSVDVASLCFAGVSPIRSSYEDVTTAAPADCECTTEGPDGYFDLTLKFDTQEIVAALGEVNDGDVLPLTLFGVNVCGVPIQGTDCVVIIANDEE
jgi:hypothetical protein